MKKERLDHLVWTHGFAKDIDQARRMILAGQILVNDEVVDKPAVNYLPTVVVRSKRKTVEYVSRAGYKLAKALHQFQIDVTGLVCLDVGASTGGFTDCLLQNHARKVYALDVGTNQLAWSLRSNPQVISLEQKNFRNAIPTWFEDSIDFICCDVSFISLDKLLAPMSNIIRDQGELVLLIKPQFEAKREEVVAGQVLDPVVHERVIKYIINLAAQHQLQVQHLSFSPILGNKKANIEYLCHLRKTNLSSNVVDDAAITKVVASAQQLVK